jgi:spore maturation protein CgeB
MTTPWLDMEKTFTPGKDIVIFKNETELKEKINYYLENEEERNLIAFSGYAKVQDYLPKSWAKKIMEYAK